MAQAEQTQKYSNSSSGGADGGGGGGGNGGGGTSTGRSCKKLNQKKVPQRGLGVAQLEKIRLEEQQKKDGLLPPTNSNIVYTGSNFCLNASPNDLHLHNSIPRQHSYILNNDATHPNSGSVSLSNNAASNRARESQKLDNYHALAMIQSNGNLPYETKTPVWVFPGIVHNRAEQFQHPYPLSMVNVPSGNLNSQIEPPSNQIYRGNNCAPQWQEEERMVGMKRSYPFVIEDAPAPSLTMKYPPAHASLMPRTDEAAPCSNDGISTIEPANTQFLREFPLSSNGMSEPKNKKITKDSGGFNGDFLTLAPPRPELSSSYLRNQCPEVPDFDALPHQDIADESVKWPELGRPIHQPFFNFLPPASAVNGQSTSSNGEQAEVDVSLKL